MRCYIAFLKKEYIEYSRNYKLFIMMLVFLLLGMMAPILTKMLPDILASSETEGITIILDSQDITALVSFQQFYNNITMGLIALVLIFNTTLTEELRTGKLINILTKGMKRSTIIAAKFTSSLTIWTGAYTIAFFTTHVYNQYLFPNTTPKYTFSAGVFIWVFGVMLITFILLGSVILKGTSGGLFFTGLMSIIFMVLGFFPKFEKYNPSFLITENVNLLNETTTLRDFYLPLSITLLLIFISLIGTLLIFNKRAL